MQTRSLMAALAGLALAGCTATHGPGRPIPVEGDSITLMTGPCFGRCPVYTVTVRPNGTGSFVGQRFTSVTGEKAFTLSRAQYDAFAARLAPYRPKQGDLNFAPGEPNCPTSTTDMPSVDVIWTREVGDSQHLHYYFGCNWRTGQPMRDALGNASDLLPIEAMIGPRP